MGVLLCSVAVRKWTRAKSALPDRPTFQSFSEEREVSMAAVALSI